MTQQQPELEIDGVSQWSLVTLQRRLRANSGDEFATVSTYMIRQVLHEAGYSWQNSQSCCKTGSVLRCRQSGVVTVVNPDAKVKRN